MTQIQAKPLTPKQAKVLAWIKAYIKASPESLSPKLDEIADGMGIAKVSAFETVKYLEKKGWITRTANQSRSIRVLGRCPCCGRGEEVTV